MYLLQNSLLAFRLVWPAGLGVGVLAAAGSGAARRWLLRGAAAGVPAAFFLHRYRWFMGGREALEVAVALTLVPLLFALLVISRWRDRPAPWGALGFLLPQAALWELAAWPFVFSPQPVGAATVLTGSLLQEAGGIPLGSALGLAGLAMVAALGRLLPGTVSRRLALTVAAIYAARHLVVLGQVSAANGAPIPEVLFGPLLAAIDLLPRFPELTVGLGLLWCAAGLVRPAWELGPPGESNPAQLRKHRSGQIRRRRLATAGGVLLVGFIALGAWREIAAAAGAVVTPVHPVTAENGEIRIPRRELDDHRLHHYVYTAADGTEVKFLALHKAGSLYGVGLNYCAICGRAGYYQRGETIVCSRCASAINRMSVGFRGGCNPVPLDGVTDGDWLRIQQEAMLAHLQKFKAGS